MASPLLSLLRHSLEDLKTLIKNSGVTSRKIHENVRDVRRGQVWTTSPVAIPYILDRDISVNISEIKTLVLLLPTTGPCWKGSVVAKNQKHERFHPSIHVAIFAPKEKE